VTTFENNRNIFFVSPDNPIIHPPSPLDKNLAFVLKRIIYFPDNILTDDNINKKRLMFPKLIDLYCLIPIFFLIFAKHNKE
jgi:hypothetical protein